MKQSEAIETLKKAVKTFDKPEGELYFVSLGEDEKNYYFDICVIPPDVHFNQKNDEQIADKYAISPPWFVNKSTGKADINWGVI